MGEKGVTRRSLEWVLLLLGWILLAGPIGFVMYAVTTFLFAFSGGQYRMTPIVGAASDSDPRIRRGQGRDSGQAADRATH